jgi:hypothetical protein
MHCISYIVALSNTNFGVRLKQPPIWDFMLNVGGIMQTLMTVSTDGDTTALFSSLWLLDVLLFSSTV